MTFLWYPGAKRLPQSHNGSFTGGPIKGVLHSTETPFGNHWASYRPGTHPHLEIIGLVRSRRLGIRQFYPFNQPARALADGPNPTRTNRDGAIQIELGFKAAQVDRVPDWYWDSLAEVLRRLEDELGINPDHWLDFIPYPDSYGKTEVRLSPRAWESFDGWCGHMHVPENAHGDPGAIPVKRLRRPTRTFYTVKPGDKLRTIAAAHGTTPWKILRLNVKIKPGRRLRVR